MSPLTRRQLLTAAAGTAAAAATTRATARSTSGRLPAPRSCGIDHIVVVMMENRSFDHYLGWLPGADGKQAGLSYRDDHGDLHRTHRMTGWQGCASVNPDHGYDGGRVQFNDGRMDGFRRGRNDDFAIGYYTRSDLAFYGELADKATVFDRWFCSILGPTEPNRLYSHAGRTDRVHNSGALTSMPTIWDRLDVAGISARYYFSDVPFLTNWGDKYVPIARPLDEFFVDAAAGRLPAYSYLEPSFIGSNIGGSNDDHPHADIRRGQALVSQIAAAVVNSPQWSRTALVVTYDEWGGFFDHVPPPRLTDEPPRGRHDHAQAGFRVPAFLLSPFARPGAVDHATTDHTAVLRFVEWRFGLQPLAPRDAASRNLATALDFSRRRQPPYLPVVPDPGPHVCPAPATHGALEDSLWATLLDRALDSRAWRQLL